MDTPTDQPSPPRPDLGMTADEFRAAGHAMIDWIAEYLESAERYPVLSQVRPGEVREAVAGPLPERPEPWDQLWQDFAGKVLPGVTHWQSPSFFGYFPANVSYPSILGELLSAGLGVNGMLWSTSPAATELEQHVMDWYVDLLSLPKHFKGGGSIQDTASSSSLLAILAARERALDLAGNELGLHAAGRELCVYVSEQAHSSIEKGARIAGLGSRNVRLIETDESFRMDPVALRRAIDEDRRAGRVPAIVVATMGTTSSMAFDPVRDVGEIAREAGAWLHVDGAMAGTALCCPEFRGFADGLELADSFCFNPHKWMVTNFDCDAFFVREPERLVRAMSIMPEYLRASQAADVVNYRDWQIPLGRRFRALKVWFVVRTYGAEAIRSIVRRHVAAAEQFAQWVREDERFEIAAPPALNLVCFRLRASDEVNRALLDGLNATGEVLLTHTKLRDRMVLRLCVGQTRTQIQHVRAAWRLIRRIAADVLPKEA